MSVDPTEYPTMFSALRKVFKNEGIAGLWRGNVLNVIRIMPQGAISFFTKDALRDLMPDPLRTSSLGLALSSMASGGTPTKRHNPILLSGDPLFLTSSLIHCHCNNLLDMCSICPIYT